MAGWASAIACEFSAEGRGPEFVLDSIARRRCDTPARPRSARPRFGLQQQTARTIAFGEQQQTAAGFEVECFAARAERAEDDSAWRREPLLGRP